MRRGLVSAMAFLFLSGCNEPATTTLANRPPDPSCDNVSAYVEASHPNVKHSARLETVEKLVCFYSLNEIWARRHCSIPYDAPPLFGTEARERTYGLRRSTIDLLLDSMSYVEKQETALLSWEIANKDFLFLRDTDSCLKDMHDVSGQYDDLEATLQSLQSAGY